MRTQVNKIERQEQILYSLAKFNFLTRTHIQKLHRLGGDRNAQKVLFQMKDYLHSFRDGYDTVYYLSRLGREMIGLTKQVKRTLQTKHNLMRNDFFFYTGCPSQWWNERKVSVDTIQIRTDAIFVKDKKYHFLEVDNMQTMTENRNKIARYKALFEGESFQKEHGYFPTLHIVTVNKNRMRRFKEMCEGMPVQVYLIDEIK